MQVDAATVSTAIAHACRARGRDLSSSSIAGH
jgi:hypothetical protein